MIIILTLMINMLFGENLEIESLPCHYKRWLDESKLMLNSESDSIRLNNKYEIKIITQNVCLCKGENYTFPDDSTVNNITENISYKSFLKSKVTGCDSVIITNIGIVSGKKLKIHQIEH